VRPARARAGRAGPRGLPGARPHGAARPGRGGRDAGGDARPRRPGRRRRGLVGSRRGVARGRDPRPAAQARGVRERGAAHPPEGHAHGDRAGAVVVLPPRGARRADGGRPRAGVQLRHRGRLGEPRRLRGVGGPPDAAARGRRVHPGMGGLARHDARRQRGAGRRPRPRAGLRGDGVQRPRLHAQPRHRAAHGRADPGRRRPERRHRTPRAGPVRARRLAQRGAGLQPAARGGLSPARRPRRRGRRAARPRGAGPARGRYRRAPRSCARGGTVAAPRSPGPRRGGDPERRAAATGSVSVGRRGSRVFAEGRCARLAAVTRTAGWREAAAGWREAPVGLVAGAALAALLRGAGPGRLVAGALAGGLVAAWGGRRAAGGTRGEAAAPMSGRAPAEPEAAAPGHSLAHVVERLAPWLTLACLVPALTLAVPPGADMAMHVALARALRAGAAELSPAWPGVAPLAYPRGFSALVALAGGLGLARAGLLLAGASYALFARGAAATFAAGGLRRPWTLAALLLFLAKTPQDTFAWGGTPTVLALALGLHAAALLRRAAGWHPGAAATAALLLAGAAAVHPMGASAGALVTAVVAGRQRPRGTILALAALGAVLALLAGAGPALSPAELQWMASWGRTREALLRGAPWQFPLRIWPALWRALGPPWLVAVGAAALLLAGRRAVRPVALGLGGVLALATLIAGLHALGLAGLVYPVRLAPLFALATAPVLDAALAGLPARAAGAAAALGLA